MNSMPSTETLLDLAPTSRPEAPSKIRLFAPSLTDFFLLAVIFWLFLADPQGWDRLVWDGDVALHTRTGDYILDNGAVPTTDVFSFTRPGERWFALQWLTGVLFAWLNRLWGLKGIVLFCGALIGLYHAIVLRDAVRRGANGLISLMLALMASNAGSIHFHARPHLFTLLFAAVSGYLIAREELNPSWRLWLMVPMTALWANLHSGFPLAVALLVVFAAGSALSAQPGSLAAARRFGIAAALSSLASLANPNGWELHRHIWSFLGNDWIRKNVSEYQSPVFGSEAMSYFMLFLFAALFASNEFARRRQFGTCLMIWLFGAASLTSARHGPIFVVLALPPIAVVLTGYWNEFTANRSRRSVWAILAEMGEKLTSRVRPVSAWSVVALLAIGITLDAERGPADLSAKYFPRQLVKKHAAQLAAANVFTSDQWGDYLLWVNYPKQKVFIDGRSDFFGEGLGKEYITLGAAGPGWRNLIDRYRINAVLAPPDAPITAALRQEPRWRVVDADKSAVLLTLD